jgi:hypothetical protein
MPANIDQLTPTRNLIDLSSHSDGDFGMEDYVLSQIYNDIILVEFIDLSEDGDTIKRGSIYIPTNTLTQAWRKAKVILVGTEVKNTKVGDIVMFPNDKGVSVSGMEVAGYGKIKRGMFLNEQRLFGKCAIRETNEPQLIAE